MAVARWLGGEADARWLERSLKQRRFAPLHELFEMLSQRCQKWRAEHAERCAPSILQVSNAQLFGSLVSDGYTTCALAPPEQARRVLAITGAGFVSALETFLGRLEHALRARLLGAARGAKGRLRAVALRAHRAETHNGGQFTIEVRLSDGRTWAYKPRPADGEALLLGDSGANRGGRGRRSAKGKSVRKPVPSLFERINRLRPAAGEPQLPTLRVVPGQDEDVSEASGASWHGWHEWIEPPRQLVVLREALLDERRHQLTGCRLPARRAARYWYGAGCVSAACLAFGATDLFADNVRVGRRRGDPEPRLYPIDVEMFGYPLRRLSETGLLGDQAAPNAGLGAKTMWRSDDAPLAFFRQRRGGLRLERNRQPWARTHAHEVMSDEAGNVGHAAYLAPYLRGLFDQWVTLLQRKRELGEGLRAQPLPAPRVRVLVRPTLSYGQGLDRLMTGAPPEPGSSGKGGQRGKRAKSRQVEPMVQLPPAGEPPWSDEEREQLRRLDVPYFVRKPDSELTWRGGASALHTRPAGPQPYTLTLCQPSSLEQRLDQLTLAQLGVAMRDAVLAAAAELPPRPLDDRRLGVAVRLEREGANAEAGKPRKPQSGGDGSGDASQHTMASTSSVGSVAIVWREAGQRVSFHWSGSDLRVELTPLHQARRQVAAPAVRKQLLRLDLFDGALRKQFVDSRFQDRAVERKLEKLVRHSVAWLEEVLAEHGFPGHSLVGRRATAAACRLVQHAVVFPELQRRCLRLLEDAVARGEAEPRHVAYLTDQVRLGARQKQLYGTKFRRHRGSGELVPVPIEDAESVDLRRSRMGLDTLASYTRRIRRTFAPKEPA